MKRGKIKTVMVLITLIMLVVAPLAATVSETMTIEGEVNDTRQVVGSDGAVYDIADNDQGNELIESHIGEKVKVTGTVAQDQDVKIITVTDFEMIEE